VATGSIKNLTSINIKPEKILILPIQSFLQSQLSDDQQVLNIKTHSLNSNIATSNLEDVSFQCNHCDSANHAIARISHANKSQSFHIEMGRLKKVLVSKNNIQSFAKLNINMFEQKMVSLKNNDTPFLNLDDLKYYRLAKALKAGKPLYQKNAIKNNIVQYGSHVTCFYQNKGILLKSQAISKANGQINDFISLMHPKTKKIFNGKVIGINKVQVEI